MAPLANHKSLEDINFVLKRNEDVIDNCLQLRLEIFAIANKRNLISNKREVETGRKGTGSLVQRHGTCAIESGNCSVVSECAMPP